MSETSRRDDDTWYTSDSLTPEKLQKNWIELEVPPLEPGLVRIYRGVKPYAVQTELMGPLTEEEIAELRKLSPDENLTAEQFSQLQQLQARALTGAQKFFTDSYVKAKEYAKNGTVYYLDTPQENVQIVENGNAEIAIKLPFEVAKQEKPFAIGPESQQLAATSK